MDNALPALGLTVFAGMATMLGGGVVFARRPSRWMLSLGLGLSTGIMVYVSLVELLPTAEEMVASQLGAVHRWLATLAFFGGIGISALIDRLVPQVGNPHEAVRWEDVQRVPQGAGIKDGQLHRLGVLSAVAIGIHNFPEGMATFASALSDLSLGVTIAVAVAIHNIPEGIAVAVPVYFATGSRAKALWFTFVSGIAEPVGALLVYLFLLPVIDDVSVGLMLAATGGVMVFISLDELLPTAREYGQGHTVIGGVVLGMAVMAVSLLML